MSRDSIERGRLIQNGSPRIRPAFHQHLQFEIKRQIRVPPNLNSSDKHLHILFASRTNEFLDFSFNERTASQAKSQITKTTTINTHESTRKKAWLRNWPHPVRAGYKRRERWSLSFVEKRRRFCIYNGSMAPESSSSAFSERGTNLSAMLSELPLRLTGVFEMGFLEEETERVQS